MASDKRYDAIIIGAGHNGLVSASYLAKSDLSVLVLERLDTVGGGVTTDEFAPGFLGPMCAYILHGIRGKIIDDLKLREHGFEIVYNRSHASSFHPFPDGRYLGGPEIRDDLDMANQIREFSENDARRYFDWLSFWDQAGSILNPFFLTEPPTISDLFESVRGTRQEEVLEKILTWSFMELLDQHFEEDHIRAHFLRSPECDPRSAGSMMGTAMRRAEAPRPEDTGVPRMSMGNVAMSMESAALSLGVEIRTNAAVDKVIVEDGNAVGVRLASGEEIRGGVIASNADPKRTFSTLFESDLLSEETHRKVKRWKTQAGCVKFLAGLTELPDLSGYLGSGYDPMSILHLRIMPSVEYHIQSWEDCAAGRPSTCPIMSIQFSTVAEPGLVRGGQGHVMSNWVLYENPDLQEGSWSELREKTGEQLIDIISEYAPNFRNSLVEWTVQTPEDIETRVGMTGGNIRHLDEIPSQLLDQRQSYRTEIRNFYMCGSGTHPEGEVTGAPGHNAAHAILRDLERLPVS